MDAAVVSFAIVLGLAQGKTDEADLPPSPTTSSTVVPHYGVVFGFQDRQRNRSSASAAGSLRVLRSWPMTSGTTSALPSNASGKAWTPPLPPWFWSVATAGVAAVVPAGVSTALA
eukprot:6383284-Amphidinium_carterae.2